MRLAALILLLTLAACTSIPPADPVVAAGYAEVEARATEIGRAVATDNAAYATQAQATAQTIQLTMTAGEAKATAEMALAQRLEADAQAARVMLQATQTAMVAQATVQAVDHERAAGYDALQQDEALQHTRRVNWIVSGGAVLAVLIVLVLLWQLRGQGYRIAKARADEAAAKAARSAVMDVQGGTIAFDGRAWSKLDLARHPGAEQPASEAGYAGHADIRGGRRMGPKELFVRECATAAGWEGNYIPRWDKLRGYSAQRWTELVNDLIAWRLLPGKSQGERTMLHHGWTLQNLLVKVKERENQPVAEQQPPSPTGEDDEDGA